MKEGITLIELLISVAIISILASMTIPITRTTTIRSREYELKRNLRMIRNAIDKFEEENGSSNNEANESSENTKEDENDEANEKIEDIKEEKNSYPMDLQTLVEERYLRRIPRDPFSKEENDNPNSNWLVIASKEDEDDVYDVQSKSKQISLGGIPYEEW